MIHPTNPSAVRVKRDGPRGWHWVAEFNPAIHERYVEKAEKPAPGPEAESEAPAVEPVVKPKAKRKRKGK
jgi:hypothetical protein